ncbi:GNAT family N-acetyltransferase [Scytonema millei]|uniref:GNAT family N-acetyltransferase n=1 Tax=Scytonema millei TaxID=1245922 RepID=UPI00398C07C8
MLEIETARLQLRQFADSDLEDYARLLANPEYTRYSPKGIVPLEQAREASQAAYKYFTNHWQQSGFGVWAVCDRYSHKLLGQCGLNCLPDSDEVEVLYRLDPAYWNQGMATEAAKASLRYGFEQVKLDEIVALTLPHHLASRRVMAKAGLHYVKNARIYSLDVVYYTLHRIEYQPDDSVYVLLV